MLSLQDIDNIILNGGVVVDVTGEKIGSVEQVFTSGDSGDPVFVTVRTGLFGMSESFTPLSGASLDGSVIRVAFAKDTVKNGPRIDSDRGTITETQEQELYSYYGLDVGASNERSTTGSGLDDSTVAAEEAMLTPTTADFVGAEGQIGAVGSRTAGHRRPHPLPHGVPPPLPSHLHKHVPPHMHPGLHSPPRPLRGPGEPGPIQ